MDKKILLEDIKKSYHSQLVLNSVSLEIEEGEFFTLVGPSGVGKTTLLKIIANIESIDSGKLTFLPSQNEWKPCIMVFQDFMLFPHSNVLENIAYGLHSQNNYRRVFPSSNDESRKRLSLLQKKNRKKKISKWVQQHLNDFGLEGLAKKYPSQLSAGQQQRVALARAIIIQPSLLLLDEPFANLDQNLKMETALFLRTIQKKYSLTTIAVTHDLEEAFAMSDRIGVMLDSKLLQVGPPENIYSKPLNQKVGSFLGSLNYLEYQDWSLCQFYDTHPNEKSEDFNILVRSESIDLIPDKKGVGLISQRTFLGSVVVLHVSLNPLISDQILPNQIRPHQKIIIVKHLSSSLKEGDRVNILIRNYLLDIPINKVKGDLTE